jgi:hypothetical protein
MNRAVLFCLAAAGLPAQSLRMLDGETGAPVFGAVVTAGGVSTRTDAQGRAEVRAAEGETILVRAAGYRRSGLRASGAAAEVRLTPFKPKALYLTPLGLVTRSLRKPVLELLEQTEVNALVIDVKGDRGWTAYPSRVPLAGEIGAARQSLAANAEHIERLRASGVYLIARIVVFKDHPLALARPEWAVRTVGGAVWRDREDLAWTDPFQRGVWDYNLAIAEEAAQKGFDEIQFDYVRFPDAGGLAFSQPNTRENRVRAIRDFLREARRRLAPYNVFLAADIFGYVIWNLGDTEIGQQLEDLAREAEYLCPMLYPSGFQYGIPGYRMAAAHPYEIVRLSLERAVQRAPIDKLRFRPWLQAFQDYAFDRRAYGPEQIRAQIRAAEDFGADGWMIWNPRNTYPRNAFRSE